MPGTYTYPGIYIEEVPSAVRTIAGAATSDTAFIDFFARGPIGEAVEVTSLEDFNRKFGGLNTESEASYAIQQYYLNGGSIAWVVRVAGGAPVAARIVLQGGSPPANAVTIEARDPGLWGKGLQVAVDYRTRAPQQTSEFNLVVREVRTVAGRRTVVASEVHRNLSMVSASPRNVQAAVNNESLFVRVTAVGAGDRPSSTGTDVTSADVVADVDDAAGAFRQLGQGQNPAPSDGTAPGSTELIAGLSALDRIAPRIFNLLCLPAASNLTRTQHRDVVSAAEKFCLDHRAFLVVDPPADVDRLDQFNQWMAAEGAQIRHNNAAVYFPRVFMSDPLNESRPREVGPSGTVAGVYARTDATRGVWKAPAGTDATTVGVEVPVKLTDAQHGGLNPLGLNALRSFPIFGNVVWGARTLNGADAQASEWKYIPIRRTALYIEESLYQGLKWVVFEPNSGPLWSQIRLNVGAFMNNLFRQGAFQGDTPAKAYFVKCDAETTTQTDIDRGIVNILVGFAPLKPAEFVVIKLEQMAGQIQT
jgi:phage tail sheath protein FI